VPITEVYSKPDVLINKKSGKSVFAAGRAQRIETRKNLGELPNRLLLSIDIDE
jgi:hypothetical protein